MIQALIFDCFGVLTTDLWKEFVATLPAEQVESARDLNYAFDSGRLTREEFFHSVETLTGRRARAVENLLEGEADKNVALLELITELKPPYKIGLLSNVASNWIRDTFLTADELALFDATILSHEVGMAKPDPDIFALIAARLDVPAEACVMIDDSERHVASARASGMQGIVYKNFQQMKLELEALLPSRRQERSL